MILLPLLFYFSRLQLVNSTSPSSSLLSLLHVPASLPPFLPLLSSRLLSSCLPSTPSPTIPSPTIPSPTIPSPTIPSPTIPSPTTPSPTIPSPTIPSRQLPLTILLDMQLWGVACGGKTWTRPAGHTTGEKVSAVGVWVGLGLVRTWFLLCWAFAVVRSYAPRSNSRLCGRTTVHQSDFLIWGHLPDRYTNDATRFRFCRVGCRARDEPLADRVYHCSYFGTLHAKGKRRDASVHLALYDHFCGWLRVCV